MKMIPFFTHPQAILGVYDFLLCFRRPLWTPWSRMDYFYDGTSHSHYKAWKSQDIFF